MPLGLFPSFMLLFFSCPSTIYTPFCSFIYSILCLKAYSIAALIPLVFFFGLSLLRLIAKYSLFIKPSFPIGSPYCLNLIFSITSSNKFTLTEYIIIVIKKIVITKNT